MAWRIPDGEIERLKREVSIQRLAEARGVKLKRSGKELLGLCPFHKDTDPSLRIDPGKNLWHCLGACNKGGDVISWLMHAQGISFRHAVELLREDHLPLTAAAGASEPPKHGTVRKLSPPLNRDADDRALLLQVVSYYNETLKQSTDAMKYLEARGLKSSEIIERFRLGFANRTLGYRLPDKNRLAGAELRGRLQKLGLYRDSGHEHFNGSLVVPIFDLNGDVMQMYGRKITRALREGTPEHLYLPGPHRGVWNEQALIASKEIILCEALIDALTFWCAGYRHVTTSYGVNGFTSDIKAAFQKHDTKKVYLAYDRDQAGESAAQTHGEELMQMGIECFRVQFPKNMDANEYALKTQPATKALAVMLNGAAWLGKGKRPDTTAMQPARPEEPKIIQPQRIKIEIEEPITTAANAEPPIVLAAKMATAAPTPTAENQNPEPAAKEKNAISAPTADTTAESVLSLAADPEAEQSERAPRSAPLPSVLATTVDVPTEIKGEEIIIWQGERRYRVRGLAKNMSYELLRVNVLASHKNLRGEDGFHVDTLDLYSARQRSVFIKQASEELGIKDEIIRHDLGRVLLKLEELQDGQIKKALEQPKTEIAMSQEESAQALELLRQPNLLDRILTDFERCGVVGEETNKKISYLAAVSRLLRAPLAVVVQSSSAAGKTSLMEAVLDFVPPEQRQEYSAMTGQALFYMGEKELKHKVLAVSEEEGAQRAAYALKLLQSEGVLTIASTGKDPVSGKHVTHEYRVEGPVMIFITTTAVEMDEELLNRCMVLTVNEDPEQTKAIHQKQREARTLDGLWARQKRAEILALHRNAQRLLKTIEVVNNHAINMSFPYNRTRARRDHMKFLTLIDAIALLHQHQREIKTSTRDGQTLEYIEATEADVQLALQLVNQVLPPSLDELQPQTRRLLLFIEKMVAQQCEEHQIERAEYRFSRRLVRHWTQWGDSQLKKHLARLEEMEYLIVHRGGRGQSYVYELDFETDENGKPVVPGLKAIYNYDEKKSRANDHLARGGHGQVTGMARGGHAEESRSNTGDNRDFYQNGEKSTCAESRENPVIAKANGRASAALAGVK
jgi:DNA primase catalytic core